MDSLQPSFSIREPGRWPGIVGTWLNGDAAIPDDTLDGFGDGSALAELNFARVYHTLSLIPGADGRQHTADDRVLVTGGGASVIQFGGEPVDVSSEVYVQR